MSRKIITHISDAFRPTLVRRRRTRRTAERRKREDGGGIRCLVGNGNMEKDRKRERERERAKEIAQSHEALQPRAFADSEARQKLGRRPATVRFCFFREHGNVTSHLATLHISECGNRRSKQATSQVESFTGKPRGRIRSSLRKIEATDAAKGSLIKEA